jgi:hypothetical protein
MSSGVIFGKYKLRRKQNTYFGGLVKGAFQLALVSMIGVFRVP